MLFSSAVSDRPTRAPHEARERIEERLSGRSDGVRPTFGAAHFFAADQPVLECCRGGNDQRPDASARELCHTFLHQPVAVVPNAARRPRWVLEPNRLKRLGLTRAEPDLARASRPLVALAQRGLR